MGLTSSKLTSSERSQLEEESKKQRVVLVTPSLDPILDQVTYLLQPLCGHLSIFAWGRETNATADPYSATPKPTMLAGEMETDLASAIRKAHKIVLVNVLEDTTRPLGMLGGDKTFAGLYVHLLNKNVDMNELGRVVCCHAINRDRAEEDPNRPSDIFPTLIKYRTYHVPAVTVNIPFTRLWQSLKEVAAATEHLLMALNMPLTISSTTLEPLKAVLSKYEFEAD